VGGHYFPDMALFEAMHDKTEWSKSGEYEDCGLRKMATIFALSEAVQR